MIERIRRSWSDFWWRPANRIDLAMARVVIASTALWIVLSRFDLPSVITFPHVWWMRVLPERKLRFFIGAGLGTERILWLLLHLALVAVIAGVFLRVSSFIAGLLLYHFGALETVLWTGNPYLRGYTIPALALLIIAMSASAGRFDRKRPDPESWENRWPVALIQFFFAGIYFWAAYAKLYTSGVRWIRAENMRLYIAGIDQWTGGPHPPLNQYLLSHPAVLSAMAVAGLLFDASFALALFSRRARRILIPIAVFFHIANGIVFHIWFQNAWLLLVYADWNSIAASLRRRGIASNVIQPSRQ